MNQTELKPDETNKTGLLDEDVDDDKVQSPQVKSELERWPWYDTTLVVLASVIFAFLLSTIHKWFRICCAMFSSSRGRVLKSASNLESIKMEGFMQKLQDEVRLMSRLVSACDAFQLTQTRLVVIFDGLDSCDPERILQLLDTINILLCKPKTPFITVLAIDPHIVIRGIEQNLHPNLFTDATINGFDYLRNIVHLPLFIQNSRFGKTKPEQNQQKKLFKDSVKGKHRNSPASSYVGLHRKDTHLSQMSIPMEEGHLTERQLRRKARRPTGSVTSIIQDDVSVISFGGQEAGDPNAKPATANIDISKIILKHDYFSDINPRSIRRLINIVAVQARLLRAHEIEFEWHRLVSWVNVTEQWPYRISYLIVYAEDNDATLDAKKTLRSIYDQVSGKLNPTDPLIQIDRNFKKLEFTLGHSPKLSIGDIRKFLPFTINLDPYLCKHIKENQSQDATLGDATAGVFQPGRDYNPYQGTGSRDPHRLVAGAHVLPGADPDPRVSQAPLQQSSALGFQQRLNTANVNSSSNNPFANYRPAPLTAASQPVPSLMIRGPTPPVPREETIHTMSAADVAVQMSLIPGLTPDFLPKNIAALSENNVNGQVILSCDLSDLQALLNMNFGDWQLFKAWILRHRSKQLIHPPHTIPGHEAANDAYNVTTTLLSSTSVTSSNLYSSPEIHSDATRITGERHHEASSLSPQPPGKPLYPPLPLPLSASQASNPSFPDSQPPVADSPVGGDLKSGGLCFSAPVIPRVVPPHKDANPVLNEQKSTTSSAYEAESLAEMQFLSGFMPIRDEDKNEEESDWEEGQEITAQLVRSVSGTSLPSMGDSTGPSSRNSFNFHAPYVPHHKTSGLESRQSRESMLSDLETDEDYYDTVIRQTAAADRAAYPKVVDLFSSQGDVKEQRPEDTAALPEGFATSVTLKETSFATSIVTRESVLSPAANSQSFITASSSQDGDENQLETLERKESESTCTGSAFDAGEETDDKKFLIGDEGEEEEEEDQGCLPPGLRSPPFMRSNLLDKAASASAVLRASISSAGSGAAAKSPVKSATGTRPKSLGQEAKTSPVQDRKDEEGEKAVLLDNSETMRTAEQIAKEEDDSKTVFV